MFWQQYGHETKYIFLIRLWNADNRLTVNRYICFSQVRTTYKSSSRISQFNGSIKHAVAALGLHRYKTASKFLFRDPDLKEALVEQVERQIRKECEACCKPRSHSKFRVQSFEDLKSVNLLSLVDEIKRNAPTAYSALCGIAQRKFRLEERKSSIRSAIAFGMLLNMRNRKINAIQKLMSVLLYKGKARVKVTLKYWHVLITFGRLLGT